jgi:hypothetical protein
LPPAPPIARDLLARVVALDLRPDQAARLEALDRAWEREAEGLEEALREAERDFSSFMKDAQATRGASVQEIQRRSAEYSQLSATLRERRRRHADAALAVLVGWQRDRLAHEGRPDVGRDR